MNLTFRPSFLKPWTLTDDSVIYGGQTIKLRDITSYSWNGGPVGGLMPKNGVISVFAGGQWFNLAYGMNNSRAGKEAAQYIEANYGDPEARKLQETIDSIEFKMRCNTCGKVFCYSMKDLEMNQVYAQNVRNAGSSAVVSSVFGSSVGTYANINRAEHYLDKIKDYHKCPNCNSGDVTRLTEDAIASGAENKVAGISGADELMKFKNLLDSGVITQEEFDVKKKQILGL